MGRRARPSWPIWVTAAAALTMAMTIVRARRAPQYTVTVGLLVREGALRTRETREELSDAALRAHLKELTFTRTRLAELFRSHAALFPSASKDPDGTFEEVRDKIKFDVISESDVLEEADAPRSAHVTLSYTASSPQAAWTITHALADLMIDSALARQRAALLREQVGAQAAVESVNEQSDTIAAEAAAATLPFQPTKAGRSLGDRMKATQAQAAAARLGVRAAEEQQTLRFELVDPGRIPPVIGRASLVGDGFVTLGVALLAACLLAGAFDPRVIDAGDVVGLGVPLIGRLPLPPGAPDRVAARPRNAPDASPLPSDDL